MFRATALTHRFTRHLLGRRYGSAYLHNRAIRPEQWAAAVAEIRHQTECALGDSVAPRDEASRGSHLGHMPLLFGGGSLLSNPRAGRRRQNRSRDYLRASASP